MVRAGALPRNPLAGVSLAAIGVVVALVSLPSLRGFALRQNQSDALRLVHALAAAVAADPLAGANPSLSGLLERNAALRHRFNDLELVTLPGSGERLRCHGYLFDLAPASSGWTARAWPWSHGRTGRAAFVVTPSGRLFGHANATPRWSGPDRPPPPPWSAEAGWIPLR